MVACEPSDNILAALLQMNDELLAAVSSWDSTASRLAMLQSTSTAAASATSASTAAGHSHGSLPSRAASATAELSDSSSSSTSDRVPTSVASGGLFWSSADAEPSQASAAQQVPQQQRQRQQPQQQQQQQQSFGQLYPSVYTSPGDELRNSSAAAARQGQDNPSSNGNFLDDSAGTRPGYPHQAAAQASASDFGISNADWSAFRSNGQAPSALPSRQAASGRQAETGIRPQPTTEFHGTVLSYKLAEPNADGTGKFLQPEFPLTRHAVSDDRQAAALGSWLDEPPASLQQAPISNGANHTFDPFSGESKGFSCACQRHSMSNLMPESYAWQGCLDASAGLCLERQVLKAPGVHALFCCSKSFKGINPMLPRHITLCSMIALDLVRHVSV